MLVNQIVNVINTYRLYTIKIQKDKEQLRWELMSTGETPLTIRLRKQIAKDEESLGKYLNTEV